MKLSLLLFIAFFSTTAFSFSQRISVHMGEVTLYQALKEIKAQAKVDFFYSDKELNVNQLVQVEYTDTEVLDIVNHLVGTSFSVQKTVEGIIVISPREEDDTQGPITVKGVITDDQGTPLPGVTVLVKGTRTGTTSNFEGEYVIRADADATLVFSYIGFKSLEIALDGDGTLNVQLEADVKVLDEVILTGMMKMEKKNFTGAATTVSGEELKAVGNLNVLESLKTLDPSFVIVENNTLGSNPNQIPDIEVRGKTSISTEDVQDEFGGNPNQPLFILDGFETGIRTIIDLDMNRVASITILKDAASTALYGAKAANGVVVVETLRPQAGKMRVNYTADFRIDMPDLSDYNLMNSEQKLEYERLAGLWTAPSYDPEGQFSMDKQYNAILAEVARGVDTYWLNEPLQVGTTLGNSLYVSGGSEAITIGVGLNYRDLEGVMIGSDRKTWGTNFDMTYRKGKLNIYNKLYINGYNGNESPYGSFSKYARANPYFRKIDENGNIPRFLDVANYWGTDFPNPLYDALLLNKDNSKNLALTNNLQAIYTFNPKLRLQAGLQLGQATTTREAFTPPQHSSFIGDPYRERGSYINTRNDSFNYNLNLMASYADVFWEKHVLTTNLRGEIQENNNKRTGFEAVGFPEGTDGNPAYAYSYKPDSSPDSFEKVYRRVNLLGSLNYAYDGRYLLDFTYRLDGSTVFGSNEKYSPFWAIGLGWNIHNDFNINQDVISLLKLRGNIGTTGNQGFGSLSSVSIYNFIDEVNIFGQGVDLNVLANPDLEWQTTVDTSVGIDASFLKNRFSATFNAYQKVTDPMIVKIDLPSSTGVYAYPLNTGELDTKGFEAIVRASPLYDLKNHFTWTIGLTASVVRSEYDGFNNTLQSLNDKGKGDAQDEDFLDDDAGVSRSLLRFRDGYSPDAIWAVESLGIDPATGQEVFLNKDGQPTFEYNIEDEKVMGSFRPDVEGVISNNIRVQDFTFGMNFRYRFGGEVVNTALFNKVENISRSQGFDNHDIRVLTERWQNPGDVAKFKSISEFSHTPISSRFIQEENVLIWESINFGYDFSDEPWVKDLGLTRLRLRCYMNDMFRLSSVRVERGINYPFSRAVSFGLNAYF